MLSFSKKILLVLTFLISTGFPVIVKAMLVDISEEEPEIVKEMPDDGWENVGMAGLFEKKPNIVIQAIKNTGQWQEWTGDTGVRFKIKADDTLLKQQLSLTIDGVKFVPTNMKVVIDHIIEPKLIFDALKKPGTIISSWISKTSKVYPSKKITLLYNASMISPIKLQRKKEVKFGEKKEEKKPTFKPVPTQVIIPKSPSVKERIKQHEAERQAKTALGPVQSGPIQPIRSLTHKKGAPLIKSVGQIITLVLGDDNKKGLLQGQGFELADFDNSYFDQKMTLVIDTKNRNIDYNQYYGLISTYDNLTGVLFTNINTTANKALGIANAIKFFRDDSKSVKKIHVEEIRFTVYNNNDFEKYSAELKRLAQKGELELIPNNIFLIKSSKTTTPSPLTFKVKML